MEVQRPIIRVVFRRNKMDPTSSPQWISMGVNVTFCIAPITFSLYGIYNVYSECSTCSMCSLVEKGNLEQECVMGEDIVFQPHTGQSTKWEHTAEIDRNTLPTQKGFGMTQEHQPSNTFNYESRFLARS